jgi:hypothetical protein
MQYLLMLYNDESAWNQLAPAQKAEGVAPSSTRTA